VESNLIMRIAAGAAVVVVTGIAVLSGDDDVDRAEGLTALDDAKVDPIGFDPIADADLENEYGVDADTPEDTMRTLTLSSRQLREASQRLQRENRELKVEIDRLLEMEDTLGHRVDQGVDDAQRVIAKEKESLAGQRRRLNTLIERLEKQMADLERQPASTSANRNGQVKTLQASDSTGAPTAAGYDIQRAGIPEGLGFEGTRTSLIANEQVVWTQPLDAQVNTKTGEVSTPDFSFQRAGARQADTLIRTNSASQRDTRTDPETIPYYTIPSHSTLMGSTAMTALLGRIPTGGEVQDPYPFRIVVGPDNLATNGIALPPEVTGIVMAGYAVGDLALECVRGDVRSMTFTFASGDIVTLPSPQDVSRGNAQQTLDVDIGYLTDEYGVPCIPGQLITNAAEVVTLKTALGVAEGYANANAAGQFTTQNTAGGGLTSGLTGDPQTYAANTALASGVSEISDWYNRRVDDSWDVVYIAPGRKLSVLIDQELRLDLNPNGRKVNHYAHETTLGRTLD